MQAKAVKLGGVSLKWDKVDIFSLGVSAPIFGGTAMFSTGYLTGDAGTNEGKATKAAVGFKYPFSKSTFAYSALTYLESKKNDNKTKTTQFMAGLSHSF